MIVIKTGERDEQDVEGKKVGNLSGSEESQYTRFRTGMADSSNGVKVANFVK